MGHIKNILVPIDGSPASAAALSQAVMLAGDIKGKVDVLHVEGPDQFEVGSSTSSSKAAREEAGRLMTEAIAEAELRLGEHLRRRTVSGDPLRVILDQATAEKADLIVIGTHGRIGRLHSLIGSVAEAVVRSAPCPVMTVRRADGAEESFSERIHGRDALADQTRTPR